jgi:hypothetical protein
MRVTLRDTGEETVFIVEVPPDHGGRIYANVDGRPGLVFTPECVSRLREIWAEAQAVALMDRDHW